MELSVLGRHGPYPPAGGGTSSYLVRSRRTAVALDFGSGALGRVQSFVSLANLNAIVLSHLHNDHIADIFPLAYAPVKPPVYRPASDSPQSAFMDTLGLDCHTVSAGDELVIGDLAFSFFAVQHPVKTHAVRVTDGHSTLFYSGDTTYFPALIDYAAGANLLLLDCAQAPGSKTPHMTLEEGEHIARATAIRTLITHLPPDFAPYTGPLEIAEELKTYFFFKRSRQENFR